MNLDDYLLRGVNPEEFDQLKRQEIDLVDSVMDGFNTTWRPKVQGIRTTFKYNPGRNLIGIYVERDGRQHLAIDKDELSEAEEAVVGCLYIKLEKKLGKLRLPNENWVDSI